MTKQERQIIARSKLADMVLQVDPTVIITLGQTSKDKYTLEFDNAAVKGVLKATGVNLIETWFTSTELRDPEVIGSVLYHGLKRHHPDITQEKVDQLYLLRLHLYVIDRLRVALDMFTPDMSDVEPVTEEPAPEAPVDPTKQLTAVG